MSQESAGSYVEVKNANPQCEDEDLLQVSIDDYQQSPHPQIVKIGLLVGNTLKQNLKKDEDEQLKTMDTTSDEKSKRIRQKRRRYKSKHSEKAMLQIEKKSKEIKLKNLIVQKAQKINRNLLPSLLINNPTFDLHMSETIYSPEQRYVNYEKGFHVKKSQEEQHQEEIREELQHMTRTNSIKKFVQQGNATFMNKSYQTIEKYTPQRLDDTTNSNFDNSRFASPIRRSVQVGGVQYRNNNQTFSAENIHQSNQRELWDFVHNDPEPNYQKIISDITTKVGSRFRSSQNSNLFPSNDKLYEIRNLYQSRDNNNTIYEDLPTAEDLKMTTKFRSHQPFDKSSEKKASNSQSLNRIILEPIHQIQETKQKTEQKLQKISNKLIERSQQRRFYALLLNQQGKQENQLFRNPILNQAYQSQPAAAVAVNQTFDIHQSQKASYKLVDNSQVWEALIQTHRQQQP